MQNNAKYIFAQYFARNILQVKIAVYNSGSQTYDFTRFDFFYKKYYVGTIIAYYKR